MKFWWPHNETILATLLAHLITGNARYEAMHRQVHAWAYAHFPDAEHGEWFGGRPRFRADQWHEIRGLAWQWLKEIDPKK